MRRILFGINDLPQVMCVEDFSPYWITDNWTEERLVTDLKIMKAIGCSCWRLSLYPALPWKGDFPGVAPERFLPMLDLAVDTCQDLGIRLLLDLDQGVEEHGEEGIRFSVDRYKGRVELYQLGNERYDFPQDPKKLRWMRKLAGLVHSIDPQAKVSADMLVPDWVRMREEMPDLYGELDVALAHYYSVTDYRGWNDLYIADLLDHLGNPSGRESVTELSCRPAESDGYDAKTQSFDHPFYAGSWAWLDKEVWLTELASHGYWRWGAIVDEDKRAADWEKVVGAVAETKNPVTRIYHHAFRDKMTWREFGRDQSGIVRYDGSPRPVTWAFKRMAVRLAPEESALRALDCRIDRAEVPRGANDVELEVRLANRTSSALEGEAVLELPSGVTAAEDRFAFRLPADESTTWTTRISVTDLDWGNNHVFARITIPQGLVYGWGIIAKPTRVVVDCTPVLDSELSSRVRYLQSPAVVQKFIDEHGDDCAIITGPALGSDTEMGYRLKIVLESMRCREVPLRPSLLCADMLDRPLIVVGRPEFNPIARAIEMTLPEDRRVGPSDPGQGRGLINVVHEPFGETSIKGRLSPQAEALGYHFGSCPAALYIAGSDDTGTQAAVYDLVQRIWGRGRK